jgi:hypothetical protein
MYINEKIAVKTVEKKLLFQLRYAFLAPPTGQLQKFPVHHQPNDRIRER